MFSNFIYSNTFKMKDLEVKDPIPPTKRIHKVRFSTMTRNFTDKCIIVKTKIMSTGLFELELAQSAT